MTVHYEIQFDFLLMPSVVLIKTKQVEKAIKQMVIMKNFLDIPIYQSDIRFEDQTTSNFKK